MYFRKFKKLVDITRMFKYVKLKVYRHPATAEDLAMSVALGAFIGIMPTFGFAIVLSIFAAFALKLPKIPCFLGTWVANPWTSPIFYTLSWKIGNFFFNFPLKGNLRSVFRTQLQSTSIHESIRILINIYKPMLLGGLVLAIPASVIIYYSFLFSLREIKKRKEEKRQQLLFK